jgi:hypothetical protein
MRTDPVDPVVRNVLAEPDESEAFAQVLYSAFGGFVNWDMLPKESRSKEEYREKARHLLIPCAPS